MTNERELMEKLISDSVILLVKTSLKFRAQIEIRGVICVTVDHAEVSVIHLDKDIRPEDMVKQENCQEVTCTTSPGMEQQHAAKRLKLDEKASDAATMPTTFIDDLDNQSMFQIACNSNSNTNVSKTADVSKNASNTSFNNDNNNDSTKPVDVKSIVNQLLMQQNQQRNQQQNISQQQLARVNQPQAQNIQQNQQNVMQKQFKQCQQQQQQKLNMGTPTKINQESRMNEQLAWSMSPKQVKSQMSSPSTPQRQMFSSQQQQFQQHQQFQQQQQYQPQMVQQKRPPMPQQQHQQQQQTHLQLTHGTPRGYSHNNMALTPVRGAGGGRSRGPRMRGDSSGRGLRSRGRTASDGWSSVEQAGEGGYTFGKETVVQYVCNICKGHYKSHSSLLNHQVRNHGRQKKVGVGRKPKQATIPAQATTADYEHYDGRMEEEEEEEEYEEGGYDDYDYSQ